MADRAEILAFPYWFIFVQERSGFYKRFPERLQALLLERWFPAMNYVCEFVKMPKEQVVCLTNRVMSYLAKGRLPDIEGIEIADSDLSSN